LNGTKNEGDFGRLKSPFLVGGILIFLVVTVSEVFAAWGSFTVLAPLDKTYVESDHLSVVVNRYYTYTVIAIVPGPNKIRVEGLKDDAVEKKSSMFFADLRELTCASCHNPHASQFNHLLFRDESDVIGFCTSRHRF
jgi:predicted CXXCH cytochrome family protein